MATAGDERVPCEGGGAGKKFRKTPFLPEIKEEPQDVSQEAGKNNSSVVSEASTHKGGKLAASIGMSELEQILIQKTFTRSEIERLIELLHSRISEESPSDDVVVQRDGTKFSPSPNSPYSVTSVEASGSLKKHKHGDESDNFHAAAVFSWIASHIFMPIFLVVEEQIASPANAYKGSTGQALRQYSNLINNNNNASVASPQYPTTIMNLPTELLSNIFIRLFAKQLAQMRSVSKSWNALLSQPSFIKSHLLGSIHNSDHLLVFYADKIGSAFHDEEPPFTVYSCYRSSQSQLELTNFIKLPVNPQFENANVVEVIGSVNGLICYSHSDSVIHIWNPSLSTVLTLPPYSMPSQYNDSLRIDFRFGYDPKTDDYKVVKVTGLSRPPTYDVKWWLQIQIYSMRKGIWELITERFPSHITSIINFDYVCVDGHDGHLHWLCYIGENMHPKTIVAFDLSSETFHEIPLPHSILDRDNTLGVLAKKLCVISCRSYRLPGDEFEVWVMDEYGVPESWVKCHAFSEFRVAGIHGFTSHNEFLDEDSGDIYVHDLIANKETPLEQFHRERGYPIRFVEYVDSLVWIAPDKCEMLDGVPQN